MIYRSFILSVLYLGVASVAAAQLSQEARFEILRTVVAEQAAARIPLPLGNTGVELSVDGTIDESGLADEIRRHGSAIESGKVVTVTSISFSNDAIEIELDGGGRTGRGILDRIQIGIGGVQTGGSDEPQKPAEGSKITLKFGGRAPASLTPDELKQFLDPVLDFTKSNFLRTGIDALPVEYQEAVRAGEARIGMDSSTVVMALGRPHERGTERNAAGALEEWWLYRGVGLSTTFVIFEDGVVVRIRKY